MLLCYIIQLFFLFSIMFLGTFRSSGALLEHNSQLISYDGAGLQDVDSTWFRTRIRLVLTSYNTGDIFS